MARFFRDLHSEGLLPIRPEHAVRYHERIRRIESELFAESWEKEPLGLPLLWQVTEQKLRRTLTAYLDVAGRQSGEMVPSRFEAEFGHFDHAGEEEGGGTPVEIAISRDRALRFRGRVDRIDEAADGAFRVIDYKTCRKKKWGARDEPLCGGRRLQLMLYVDAAARMLDREVADGCVAEYLHLVPGSTKIEEDAMACSSWAEARMQLSHFLGVLVAAMESGSFLAEPVDAYACTYCSCRLACASSPARRRRAKAADGPAADFLAARDGGQRDADAD
jgi:hypothetical protein